MTIRSRILVTFLLAFLAAVALVTMLAYGLCRSALESMIGARLERCAREFATLADLRLQEELDKVDAWSHRSDLPPQILVGDLDGVVAEALHDLKSRGAFAGAIECLDRRGKVIASSVPQTVGQLRADELWYQTALRGEVHAGAVELDGAVGLALRVARPVWSTPEAPTAGPPIARQVVGVVTARVDWSIVLRLLAQLEDEEHANGFLTTTLTLVNADGVVLASRRSQDILQDNLRLSYGLSPADLGDRRQLVRITEHLQTGHQALMVLLRPGGSGYLAARSCVAIGQQSTSEAFAPSRALLFWVSLLGLGVTILLGTLGVIVLGRMVAPIKRFVVFAGQVGRGELGEVLQVTGTDDLAALGRSLNRMRDGLVTRTEELRKRALDLEQQDWNKSQINRLSNLLQGIPTLEQAARSILVELTPLMGAAQGAFYLRQSVLRPGGDAGIFEVSAGYAVAAQEPPRTIRVGVGLVGQCAAAGRRMDVDAVPAGHLTIQSGLGASAPVALVLVPVLCKGEVSGVIELASFTRYSPERLAFLDQLLPTAGMVLESIAARAHTEQLLSESRELTRLLREQSDALAQSSRYKSEFLANMSHELRTPLNSLLILAGLLAKNADGNLGAKQVEYALTIHSAGAELLERINEILDLSKIEAGKMVLTPSSLDLRELKIELLKSFRPVAEQRRLGFEIELDPELPWLMITDQVRLQQILRNLLSNAFKFTDAGRVTVHIGMARPEALPVRTALDRTKPVLFFAVQDTGIGIASDKLNLIFEAFLQADGTTSRRYGGTGLGLSISKELAKLLGGSITVESGVGSGSIFTLYLPLVREGVEVPPPLEPAVARPAALPEPPPPVPLLPAPPSTEPEGESSARDRTVLIVDDDERNTFALGEILKSEGMRVIAARNGKECLEQLGAPAGVDIILMDMMMPEMDGRECSRRVRQLPDCQELPIIAVTAKAMLGDRQACLDAGASDYLTKPVDPGELMVMMRRWLRRGARERADGTR